MAGNFTARLKQAKLATKDDITDLVKKTYFFKKLNKNKKIPSNKIRHVEVQNNLNDISTEVKLSLEKRLKFFLDRVYFTGDNGFQNMFAY